MAQGFRSLAGFPLGAGTTGVAPAVGFTSLFWWMGGLASTDQIAATRRGGHRLKLARYWKGKYAGYFDDIEWTEWLLAYLAGEAEETPAPQPAAAKAEMVIIEPEAYIAQTYPASIAGLLEEKIETVLALAQQHRSAAVARMAEAALYKKRRDEEEEDDIISVLLLH